MATISFSTKPQKRFYSYKSDGCIYNISSTEPTKIADKGGAWYCYFKCTPYAKVGDNYALLYRKNADDEYEALTSSSFHINSTVKYYYIDSSEYKEYDITKNGYYTKSGTVNYTCPNDASELPKVAYSNEENGEVITYYFDTLIGMGDSYNAKKFTPLDTNGDGTANNQTYGGLLLDKVKATVSINAFTSCIANLPEYLKKSISDISYSVSDTYFNVFGELFMEKLNEYMKGYGDVILKKYNSSTSSATIASTFSNKKGTLTITAK